MKQENEVTGLEELDLMSLRVEIYWSTSTSNVASFSLQFDAAPEICKYGCWAGSIENDVLSSWSVDSFPLQRLQ